MEPPKFGQPLLNPLPSKIHRPVHVPDVVRLKALYGVVLMMFGIFIARLWYLQIAMGSSFMEDAEKQRMRPIRRLAPRGTITDTRGRLLASSRLQYVVTVTPEEISKNPQAVPLLASILKVTPESIMQKLVDPEPAPEKPLPGRKKRTKKVKPHIGPRWKTNLTEPIRIAEKIDLATLTQIEEHRLDLDGVDVSKEPVRYYLDNKLCAHLLGIARPIPKDKIKEWKAQGYNSDDIVGIDGLEKNYEFVLRGEDGNVLVAVDAKNRMIKRVSEMAATPGRSLRLSIDMDLQRATYDSLQNTLSKGHPGSAVALDPYTGEVLAMVSTPSYDLNQFTRQYNELNRDKLRPHYNRAIMGTYACGSTFKLVTAAAGLVNHKIEVDSAIRCNGALQVGNRQFKCDGYHGNIGLETAIQKSCDVYFYNVGLWVEQPALSAMARQFGLGERTGIDIPGEHRGIVPSPEYKQRHHLDRWQKGDTVNMSIGQGYIQVTPIQLADYAAAIGNGGTLWSPHLVKEIRDQNGAIVETLPPSKRGDLGLPEQYRAAIIRGMRRVIGTGGTAPNVAIPGLDIAAKTGTAQTGRNGGAGDNSVFVCFAPADHPKIAIAVLIEKVGHGNEFAGEVAKEMLMQYFHVPKTKQEARLPSKHRSG